MGFVGWVCVWGRRGDGTLTRRHSRGLGLPKKVLTVMPWQWLNRAEYGVSSSRLVPSTRVSLPVDLVHDNWHGEPSRGHDVAFADFEEVLGAVGAGLVAQMYSSSWVLPGLGSERV